MVSGDLRPPNILIKREAERERSVLVDFDWCARAEKDRYPASINMGGRISWPVGVGPDRRGHKKATRLRHAGKVATLGYIFEPVLAFLSEILVLFHITGVVM